MTTFQHHFDLLDTSVKYSRKPLRNIDISCFINIMQFSIDQINEKSFDILHQTFEEECNQIFLWFYIALTTFSACIRESDQPFEILRYQHSMRSAFERRTFRTWAKQLTHCVEPSDNIIQLECHSLCFWSDKIFSDDEIQKIIDLNQVFDHNKLRLNHNDPLMTQFDKNTWIFGNTYRLA